MMFKWLQTSLFGPKEDASDRALEPVRKVKATRPTMRKAPLKTSVSRSVTSALGEAFLVRWKVVDPEGAIELIPVARLRQGWKLEWRRGEYAKLRVPAALLQAPDEVLAALAEWARLVMTGRGRSRQATRAKAAAMRPARQGLEKVLHAWIDTYAAQDPKTRTLARARAGRRLDRLQPKGKHHDLQAILDAVLQEYFAGESPVHAAKITWSKRWGGLSTQSHAKDADGKSYPLISISRGYDSLLATAELVGGVVYHECLHIAVPPQEVTETSSNRGRRVVHGREFRRRERLYRHYEAWRAWHAKVLPGIIRRGDKRR
jgi:hypothetical protein